MADEKPPIRIQVPLKALAWAEVNADTGEVERAWMELLRENLEPDLAYDCWYSVDTMEAHGIHEDEPDPSRQAAARKIVQDAGRDLMELLEVHLHEARLGRP